MTVPLIVLAFGAALVGVIVEPGGHQFSHFLARTPHLEMANRLYVQQTNIQAEMHPHFNPSLALAGTLLAVIGIAAAWRIYHRGTEPAVPIELRGLQGLSQNKLYVDEIYLNSVVKPAELAATGLRQVDGFLDSLARLMAFLPRIVAAALRPLQNGLVQFYALGSVLGLIVFVAFVVIRGPR
jgi:NADH-quinone oxidoreductase subunit L